MKRLNVKLLLILVVVFTVFMGSVVGVHAIQMNRNSDSLLKRAETAKTSGDKSQAIFYYRRYLSYKRQDLERYADYALLTASVAESPGSTPQEYGIALKELQNALLIDRARGVDKLSAESRAKVRRKLIDLEIGTRDLQFVAAARTLLLEMKHNGETNADDELKLAKCQIALGSYLDAAKLLETLIGYNPKTKSFDEAKATLPHEVDAYVALASLLRDKIEDKDISDRKEVADRVIDQLVKTNKDSVKALLGKAKYMHQYYSAEKAKPSIDRALELAPTDADVLLQAADMASKSKDYATAEKLLKKGIAAHPNDDRMYFTLAYLAKLQNNPKLLLERIETGLNAVPTSPTLLQLLFDQQLEARDVKAARLTLQKLGTSKYSPLFKEFREAQLLTLEGSFLEASRRLEKLRPQLIKAAEGGGSAYYVAQTDYLLMQCYQQLGLYDLTLSTARRFAAETHSLEAELGIGSALMSLGKTEEARSQFERLLQYLQTTPQKTAVPQICNTLVQLRIQEQMKLPPESRDWDSVTNYINELNKQDIVKEPTASLMRADVLAHKGDQAEVRKLLDRLAQQFPNNDLILNAQIQTALQERNFDEASRLIESAPDKDADLAIYLGRIDVILQRDDKKADKMQDLEKLSASIEKSKLPPNEQAQALLALGTAYRRLGDIDRCVETMSKAGTLQPRNAQIRWRLYDLYRETTNTSGLKDVMDWLTKEYGRESAPTKLVEAAILVTGVREDQTAHNKQSQSVELTAANKSNLRSTHDMLRTVENLRPDWYERPKLLAEIDALEGKPDEAIIDLRETLRLGPPDQVQVRRLAQLLLMQKRYTEVKEVLDTYGTGANRGLERIEAVTEQLSGRPDLALQRLEQLIPKDSTNANDHLYYGQLLAAAGKTEQAEFEMRRAIELAPQQPETWLAMIYFLMTNGRQEDAQKTVQEAQIQLPEDRRTLAIAQGYEIVGDQQQADQFYKAALDAAPKDPKTVRTVANYYLRNKREDMAKPLIKELMALKPSTPAEKETVAWARHSAAQMLAADGSYQSFLKAIEYLTPPPGESAGAADLSMRAFLLGARPDVASARQALNALQELKNLRALSTEERLLLSQVYERTGNWAASRDELLAMLNQSNAAVTTYSMFIEMLLRRNAADSRASAWLQKLEGLAKANPLLVATVAAHVASVQGNQDQAVARMMKLLPTERPLPKDKLESLRTIADLLTQMDLFEPAEKLWREYVQQMPSRTTDLALFLAKRGKVDEALQLADQRRKTDPAVLILKIGAAAARQRVHPLTPSQIQQVEGWFQRAMREDPESVPVQILYADFLDSQGRYDEVEKVYRAVLARNDVPPKDRAGVSNNLAFALAVRNHNLDEAIKLSDDTIAYLGPVSEALDTRGLVHLAKGDTKQAIRDLTDAISVLDPQPVWYFHLAMAQAAAKDYYSARHSLDKAQELKLNLDDLSPLDRKNYENLKEQLKKPA